MTICQGITAPLPCLWSFGARIRHPFLCRLYRGTGVRTGQKCFDHSQGSAAAVLDVRHWRESLLRVEPAIHPLGWQVQGGNAALAGHARPSSVARTDGGVGRHGARRRMARRVRCRSASVLPVQPECVGYCKWMHPLQRSWRAAGDSDSVAVFVLSLATMRERRMTEGFDYPCADHQARTRADLGRPFSNPEAGGVRWQHTRLLCNFGWASPVIKRRSASRPHPIEAPKIRIRGSGHTENP